MKIYPKCEHMRNSMISNSLLGSFPWQFMSQDNKNLQKVYAIYGKLLLGYYFFYECKVYVKLYFILTEETVRMDDISSVMCLMLLDTLTLSRQLVMRFSRGFINMVKLIIDREKRISATADQELLEIYDDCAKDTNQKTKCYQYIICALATQYIIGPLVTKPSITQVGNQTIIVRPLPFPTWSPFDEQHYYLAALLWQTLDSMLAPFYLFSTDSFMFVLITYPTGQLRMLQHRLKNFELYKQTLKATLHVQNDDMAAYLTFVDLIRRHKEIIEYVDSFNDTMSLLMLFDFLQSSLQIAFTLNQASGKTITFFLVFIVATFFILMMLRLIMYYYYANDVIILSENLASSVWESTWYEQPQAVKFMMLIFMMRTQKGLTFQIGPFNVMSLVSFIAILKATYSYITLMYGIN